MNRYICTKTYCSDGEEYGTDFVVGSVYSYEHGYMHSTENGTSVMLDNNELKEHFVLQEVTQCL